MVIFQSTPAQSFSHIKVTSNVSVAMKRLPFSGTPASEQYKDDEETADSEKPSKDRPSVYSRLPTQPIPPLPPPRNQPQPHPPPQNPPNPHHSPANPLPPPIHPPHPPHRLLPRHHQIKQPLAPLQILVPATRAHIHHVRLVLAPRRGVVDADDGAAFCVVGRRGAAHHGGRDGDHGVVGVGGDAAEGVGGWGVGG